MSADVWLEDENGEQLELNPGDVDAELRSLTPRRTAGGADATTVNLTYNLTPMLRAAGFPGWSEVVDKPASEMVDVFRRTYMLLRADPDTARALEPAEWGTYEDAVEAMVMLAAACQRHRHATVRGWL